MMVLVQGSQPSPFGLNIEKVEQHERKTVTTINRGGSLCASDTEPSKKSAQKGVILHPNVALVGISEKNGAPVSYNALQYIYRYSI